MNRQTDWAKEWPNYCRKCGGWGGFVYYESHGFSYGPREALFEPCDAMPAGTCHRCGGLSLQTDGEGDEKGPCKLCGWNYDDGLPEPLDEYDLGQCEPEDYPDSDR